MIEVRNLTKKFGAATVLQNINIHFEKGKVYGIVGENGAGKTTLFRCIAGLEDYDGQITADLHPLKNHLGLLLTEPYFFSKITGTEYIRLLCNGRKRKVADIAAKNLFDLPLDQYAAVYSTGMKKKLALTAILLQDNDYFILDEPFNGVDIQSNIMITEIIHTLKARNKTVIMSSHIFSTLRDTCDEIHLLQNGSFTDAVQKDDFTKLELKLKDVSIGNKMEQFWLNL